VEEGARRPSIDAGKEHNMRVLMLAPQPFFEPRGTPISVYQRLEALSTLGHEVDLVTYHVGTDIHIPCVQVFRTPQLSFIREVKIGPSWAKPLLDLLLLWVAVVRLLTKRYDVIHSHEEAAFFAVLLARLFHLPHVYDMHSSLPRQLENFGKGNWRPLIWLFERLERLTLNSCAAVITIDPELEAYVTTVNPQVRQMRIENRPIPAKLQLVDSELIQQLKRNVNLNSRQPVVYTGTFERYQGLDLLLQSAKLVTRQNPRALFILVGGKTAQIEQYRAIACREGVEDSIVFVGVVPPDEALAFLEIADVLVSPRTGGSFAPLKIYSYLYSGKPTVATRVPAHLEVLNQKVALLVEPTKEALAEGILSLLENAAAGDALGRNAYQYVRERYNSEEYGSRLDQIYKSLRHIDTSWPVKAGMLEQSEV
jgi:glycosyltransferase involved in cell wall biosynthesis